MRLNSQELLSKLDALPIWLRGAWTSVEQVRVDARSGGCIGLWGGRTDQEQLAILQALRAGLAHHKKVVLADSLANLTDSGYPFDFCGHSIERDGWTATAGEPDTGVTVMTSGSEGKPKTIALDWPELLSSAAVGSRYSETWTLIYSLTRFAGLQVLAHCLLNGQRLLIPSDASDYESMVSEAIAGGANCLSCTPSWMRRLLLTCTTESLRAWPLKQLTLGGEAASQKILDDVTRIWPTVRLTHIYAATEVGTCFSVSDRKEGIPVEKLNAGRDGKTGFLDEGELVIRHDGQEKRTGDLFEIVNGRAVFRGRLKEIINVGGNKVSPIRVETVLATHPAVDEIRVYGKRNPLLGECVVAEVVSESPTIRDDLLNHARQHLEKYEWPMIIRVVPELSISAADKTTRRKS